MSFIGEPDATSPGHAVADGLEFLEAGAGSWSGIVIFSDQTVAVATVSERRSIFGPTLAKARPRGWRDPRAVRNADDCNIPAAGFSAEETTRTPARAAQPAPAAQIHERLEKKMAKIDIPYIDISKALGEISLPGIDLRALVEARQRDLEALAKANQLAVDGMRAVADKQAELLQAVIGELGSKIKELTAKGVPSAETTDLARRTIEKALTAMRDVAEAGAQPQSAVVDVISKRVSESIAEIRGLLQRK